MRRTTEYLLGILKETKELIKQSNEKRRIQKAEQIRQQTEQVRRQKEYTYNKFLRCICAEALNSLNDKKYGLNVPYHEASLRLSLENSHGENWKLQFSVADGKKLSRVILKELVSDINSVFLHLFLDIVQEFDTEIGFAGNAVQEHMAYDPTGDNSFIFSLQKSYVNLFREKGKYLFLISATDAVQALDGRIMLNFIVQSDLTAKYEPNQFSMVINRYLKR